MKYRSIKKKTTRKKHTKKPFRTSAATREFIESALGIKIRSNTSEKTIQRLEAEAMLKNKGNGIKSGTPIFDEIVDFGKFPALKEFKDIMEKAGADVKIMRVSTPHDDAPRTTPAEFCAKGLDFGDKGYSMEFQQGAELVKSSTTSDVNHPTHYNTGKIEVIEYIEDQKFDYYTGNAIKYISRAPHKGSEIKDLKKAIWYLNRKVKNLEAKQSGVPVARPNETSI